MSKNDIVRLIREKTGCSLAAAVSQLENVAHGMGLLTRRDRIAMEIYAQMSGIPDSLENRKQSADWSVQCADELIKKLDEGVTEEKLS